MKRFVVAVFGLSVVVVACLAGRARAGSAVNAATIGWVALACLVVGGVWGARWARTRRGWADYQLSRRQVPVMRRAFTGQAKEVVKWAVVTGLVLGFALYLAGRHQ